MFHRRRKPAIRCRSTADTRRCARTPPRARVAARDQAHRDRGQAHAESAAEAAQRHQDRQAGAAEHGAAERGAAERGAAERRRTELYTRAVELLGNDSAARSSADTVVERLDDEGLLLVDRQRALSARSR
ncbi:hypothetical protein ABZU53_21790 [Micromonospora sp. NPDC005194]|uniref:hypothetical protein n=1 Tax=Micromonospora sp. NPDC005194 TaxID=3156870 RepID=UPI00339E0DA1